jgi:hypothetical protein
MQLEHLNADEERLKPENYFQEHQDGNEEGLSAEAGSCYGPERCRKVQEKQEKIRYS